MHNKVIISSYGQAFLSVAIITVEIWLSVFREYLLVDQDIHLYIQSVFAKVSQHLTTV